jgi:hypothetical protein
LDRGFSSVYKASSTTILPPASIVASPFSLWPYGFLIMRTLVRTLGPLDTLDHPHLKIPTLIPPANVLLPNKACWGDQDRGIMGGCYSVCCTNLWKKAKVDRKH